MHQLIADIKMKPKKDMKIILCTIPQRVDLKREGGETAMMPKIAIVSLTKWMEKHGYSSDFFDADMLLPSEKEIFSYFRKRQPDVVGISAVVSTSYLQVKGMSRIIRKACPSTAIVVGGNMAVSANLLLRAAEADFCVLGDGEIPFVELIDYLRTNGKKITPELSRIKGLAFLNNREMEFTGYGEPVSGDENPYTDYELLKKGLLSKPQLLRNYFEEARKSIVWFAKDPRTFEKDRKPYVAHSWVGKGCVGRCTFCQRFCKGYHVFNLKRFEDHIIELKTRYGVQSLFIAGENFGLPREFAYEVAKVLNKHDFLWVAGAARVTNFKAEDYRFFKEHGCIGVKFGIESGSKKILCIMEKNFSLEQVENAIMEVSKQGIIAPLSCCIGMPGETDSTIMETGKYIGKLSRLQGEPPNDVGLFYAMPLPGSPLYEYGQLQGGIGTSLKGEEEFLTYMSDRSSQKENYINLTGISRRRTNFWDYLVLYEATREYYSKPLKKRGKAVQQNQKNSASVFKSLLQLMLNQYSIFSLAKKVAKSPIGTLNGLMCRSRIAAKIPRLILYPVMRNLFHAEYLTKRAIINVSRIFRNNEWIELDARFKKRKCRIKVDHSQSLRKINAGIRESLPSPSSLTERNQIILYQGR